MLKNIGKGEFWIMAKETLADCSLLIYAGI